MISKAVLKEYSSLLQKKYRDQHKKFLCEGLKSVMMGLESGTHCYDVISTEKFLNENPETYEMLSEHDAKVSVVSRDVMNRLTDSKTPQEIVAVFDIMELPFTAMLSEFPEVIVYCDNISDPGNLGTIIRVADWFGFDKVLVSAGSVDVYNPKTVRSSMGSVFNTNINTGIGLTELKLLKKQGYKILSSDTRGTELSRINKPERSVLCFSSESHGPSDTVISASDGFITIPGKGLAESLNVASAASIILYHYSTLFNLIK